MAYRFRKSIKVTPGLKVNLTKRGVGMTVGGRGAHYSVHSSGRRTTSVGISGTGLSYVSTHKNVSKSYETAMPAQPTQRDSSPRPGLFASKGEKLIYDAIKSGVDMSMLEQAEMIPQFASTARLFKVLGLATHEDKMDAVSILRGLHDENYQPEKDKIVQKYASASELRVGLAPNLNLTLALNSSDLTIFLAELYRQQGKFKEASELIRSMSVGFQKSIFICLLCNTTKKYEPIVTLTNGIGNDSEQSMLLLIYRGIAMGKTGHIDAGIATFKEVLRYPSRSLDLRLLGWRERGKLYLDAGKKTLAKKDFERVFAENSEYDEINELIVKAR